MGNFAVKGDTDATQQVERKMVDNTGVGIIQYTRPRERVTRSPLSWESKGDAGKEEPRLHRFQVTRRKTVTAKDGSGLGRNSVKLSWGTGRNELTSGVRLGRSGGVSA